MIRTVAAAAAAAAVALAGAGVVAGGTPPTAKRCGLVTGARWSVGGHSGTKYAYAVHNLGCAFAHAHVPALTRQTAPLHGAKGLRGPKGFHCIGLPQSGVCVQPAAQTKTFSWKPSR